MTTIFDLAANYRSHPSIVRWANAVLAAGPERYAADQRAVTPDDGSDRVTIVQFPSHDPDAARGVAGMVQDQIAGTAALIGRTHRTIEPFAFELRARGIPISLTRRYDPWSAPEARRFVHVMRLATNPYDRLAFSYLYLSQLSDTDLDLVHGSVAQGASWVTAINTITGGDGAWCVEAAKFDPLGLVDLIRVLERSPEAGVLPPPSVFELLDEWSMNCLPRRRQARECEAPVRALLDWIGRRRTEEASQDELDPDDRVQVLTAHAAKGLEWDTVFLLGAVDGLFPHSRSLRDQAAYEEERRLFYVTATRARHRLFVVLWSHEKGWSSDPIMHHASPFLPGSITTLPKIQLSPGGASGALH